jgi:hypothetical protein
MQVLRFASVVEGVNPAAGMKALGAVLKVATLKGDPIRAARASKRLPRRSAHGGCIGIG